MRLSGSSRVGGTITRMETKIAILFIPTSWRRFWQTSVMILYSAKWWTFVCHLFCFLCRLCRIFLGGVLNGLIGNCTRCLKKWLSEFFVTLCHCQVKSCKSSHVNIEKIMIWTVVDQSSIDNTSENHFFGTLCLIHFINMILVVEDASSSDEDMFA